MYVVILCIKQLITELQSAKIFEPLQHFHNISFHCSVASFIPLDLSVVLCVALHYHPLLIH